MKRPPMYEVWSAADDELRPGPRFRALADALRYVAEHGHNLGVRNPDGSWHKAPPEPLPHLQPQVHTPAPVTRKSSRRCLLPTAPTDRARILVVDDQWRSREGLAELLRDEGYHVDTAADGDEALERVVKDIPDLIITDLYMPHVDGLHLVAELRQRSSLSDLPIILISGDDDGRSLLDGLDLGADDYLRKPIDVDALLARVRVHLRHVHRSREIIARSAVDELTGVLNRGGILGVLERERERSRREGTPLALLVIDLDDFKAINDSFGHGTGDDVLRTVAERLANAVRLNDRVGRFGGDEFLIVAPNSGPEAVDALTTRIKDAQREPMLVGDDVTLAPSLSVGSAIDDGTLDTQELFNRADAEMYRQKRLRTRVH